MSTTFDDPTEDGEVPVIANKRFLRHGGLMRCCILTVAEATHPTRVGDVLDCVYEPEGNANLVVAADGVWEWNR